MNQKLQDFSHDKSDYLRPNSNRTTYTLPSFSTDQTQSDPSNQLEVVPPLTMPSLRARRGAFTLAITALTIGFLLIAMSSPWNKDFLAPGPLASPHAQLLNGKGADRCADCHGAANESFSGWVAGQHGGVAQSGLCMKCHDNTLDAEFALHPHGISPGELETISTKYMGGNGNEVADMLLNSVGLAHRSEIACSVCHQEHHGNVSLSKLTDQQCQSCHQNTFHSFESGHPEFKSWPQLSRQNIAFDHGSHLNKHFKSANVEFNCNQCHVDGESQSVKRMASFEQACASCHSQQIADSGQKGWTLFAFPVLDMKAIEELDMDVGNWPVAATGDFDGDLPPMMRMLLAGDEQLSEVIESLPADFSFGDIDADDRESVAAAVELVWGIKRLLQTLAKDGRSGLEQRLSNVVNESISGKASSRLLAGLNPDIFQATANRWLPDLEKELEFKAKQQISDLEQHSPMRLTAFTKPVPQPAQDLLAENPVNSEGGEQFATSPVKETSTQGDLVESDQAAESSAATATATIPSAATGNSELLAENPLKKRSSATQPPPLNSPTQKRTAAAGASKSGGPSVAASPAATVPQEISLLPEVDGVLLKSGWYRNDRLLQIGYRPVNHADVIVQSWSELLGRVSAADKNAGTVALFNELNSPAAAGNCRSCHTVNRNEENQFQFAWQADQRDEARAAFTKFSHRPHLTQWSIRECSTCHRMDESVSLVGTFASCEGGHGTSNFHPITKSDCVTCHQKGRTESGCMQCHNYHVGHPQ